MFKGLEVFFSSPIESKFVLFLLHHSKSEQLPVQQMSNLVILKKPVDKPQMIPDKYL